MRKLWASLMSARQDLIKSHALDSEPLPSRLWHYHLRWLWSFIRTEIAVETKGLCWAVYRRYCRLLDRLFGGYREWEFCEWLRKGAERHEAKIREIQAERTASYWRHKQLLVAIEQRQRELDQELLAILKGEPVARDPSTYN